MDADILWPRAIMLIDMDAFFAAIEQRDNLAWRGRPLAITNGQQGSCIITCSYEARSFGIHTGMRLQEARLRCPELIQCPSRPRHYVEISRRIMAALYDISPDVEVFSVDEAFVDITRCQRLLGHPESIAYKTKQKIFDVAGLTCSIGVSGDKTTAKFAAKLQKPDGCVAIPPWQAAAVLRHVPVTSLCGIGHGIGDFLARYGVINCGDMQNIPISILGKRFGNLGRRIWYMAQGADPDPVKTDSQPPKSVGHGKVMPPFTRDRATLLIYIQHMCEKVAARLRRYHLQAQCFFMGLKQQYGGWIGGKGKTPIPCDDGSLLYALAQTTILPQWHGQPIKQVQITALDPKPWQLQQDFFHVLSPRAHLLNQARDTINARFGEFTVAPARLLKRTNMHNVIAPAWRPDGIRQSIDKESED